VDAGHRGLGHLLGQVPRLQAFAPERAQQLQLTGEVAERVPVHAGREQRAGAPYHHAVDAGIVGGGLEREPDRGHELAVHRVALLGPVEDHVADGAAVLGLYERHAGSVSG
jgi:hypothetical protein